MPADGIDGQDDKDLRIHTAVGEEALNSQSAVSSAQPLAEEERGRGKRTKVPNKWYTVKSFIHHNDDKDLIYEVEHPKLPVFHVESPQIHDKISFFKSIYA